jgi:acetyl-CoA carboxylase beta subunit
MHRELDRIDEDMIKVGAEILDPTITNEHRAQLLLDTKRMAERKGELRAEIPQFERDREEYERELESYRATLAYVE